MNFIELILSGAGASLAGGLAISLIASMISKWRAKQARNALGIDFDVDLSDSDQVIEAIKLAAGAPKIFLSYSFDDKNFAERLAKDLRELGFRAWLATEELRPGDEIERVLEQNIATSGYFLTIVSKSLAGSKWSRQELANALTQERLDRKPRVIPLLIDESEIPEEIDGKLYVDFLGRYPDAVQELAVAIRGV